MAIVSDDAIFDQGVIESSSIDAVKTTIPNDAVPNGAIRATSGNSNAVITGIQNITVLD